MPQTQNRPGDTRPADHATISLPTKTSYPHTPSWRGRELNHHANHEASWFNVAELVSLLAASPQATRHQLCDVLTEQLSLPEVDCLRLIGWRDITSNEAAERRALEHAYSKLQHSIDRLAASDPLRQQIVKLMVACHVPRCVGAQLGLCQPANLDTSCLTRMMGGNYDQ